MTIPNPLEPQPGNESTETPKTPPSDFEAMAILRQALDGASDILLQLDPLTAFTIVGMLQLVTRHPGISANMLRVADSMARQLIDGIVEATGSDEIGDLMTYGFDPTLDRDENGQPLHPEASS